MTHAAGNGSPTTTAERILTRMYWCAALLVVAAGVTGIATAVSAFRGNATFAVVTVVCGTSLTVMLGIALMRYVRAVHALADKQAQTEALAADQASALAQETTYSQQLFMLSPVGIALRDLNSRRLLDANPAYLDLIGYDLEAARALPFESLCPAELQPTNVTFRSLRETDHAQYPPSEAQYIHRLGHKIAVQLYGDVVDFRGQSCLLSAVEDISARKSMEHALP